MQSHRVSLTRASRPDPRSWQRHRLTALTCLIVAHGWAAPHDAAAADQAPATASPAVVTAFRGSLSCSHPACHGQTGGHSGATPANAARQGVRGNEYHVWSNRDPHARAYQTLFTDVSQQMIGRLTAASAPAGEAESRRRLYTRCLACHSLGPALPAPRISAQPALQFSWLHSEGVGCEACHGSARLDWYDIHKTPQWQRLSLQQRAERGFIDTSSAQARARLCVSCHVGSAGRHVDHDLLAAGHPVLKFELAAYFDLLPLHWNEETRRDALPDWEWRLWAAGQFTAAEAALEQLERRAPRDATALSQRVWPELAEYDCTGCHHDLLNTRPQTAPAGRWSWGTWIAAGSRQLVRLNRPVDGEASPAPFLTALDRLERTMISGFQPPGADVIFQADEAAARLNAWLVDSDRRSWLDQSWMSVRQPGGIRNAPDGELVSAARRLTEVQTIVVRLAEDGADSASANWEAAVQTYLMAAAWEQAARDVAIRQTSPLAEVPDWNPLLADLDGLRANLARLRDVLALPEDSHSPRGFHGPPDARTSAPPRREAARELLQRIFNQIGRSVQPARVR